MGIIGFFKHIFKKRTVLEKYENVQIISLDFGIFYKRHALLNKAQ